MEARVMLALNDRQQADVSSARGLAMAREIYRDGSSSTAELLQLRAAIQLGSGDAVAALASCDEAQAMLRDLGETQGAIAVAVAARRAEALAALRRYAEAQTELEHALATWQHLAPDGVRRHAELLAQLASLQAAAGDARAARATAKAALALVPVRLRDEIDPGLLAAIRLIVGA